MAVNWTDEAESVAKSREQAERLEAKRRREYDELLAAGRAVDLRAAMARCFAAGNHGTEALRGGFD